MMTKTKLKKTNTDSNSEKWEIRKIRELTELIFSGGTPDTRKPEYWDGDVPWLSSGETSNRFIHNTERTITKLGVDNSSTKLVKIGDVVIAAAGQGYTRGQASFCMIETYINQSLIALRPKNEVLKSLFLFYNLLSRYQELRSISDSHSSRGSLTTKLLADLSIRLPSIIEQEKISNILFSIDSKIELCQRMNKTLEEITRTLFKHWFVDFEFPNEEDEPYKSSAGDMIYNEEWGLDIPKIWEVKTLSEVTDIVDCLHITKPIESKNDAYLLQVFNIVDDGLIDLSNKFYVSDEDYKFWTKNIEVKEGDCIISNAGRVGAIGQIPYWLKSGIGRNLTAVRPTMVTPTYLVEYLFSKFGKKEIEKQTDTVTVFNTLNVRGIKKIKILIPNEKTMKKYEKIARPLRKKMESNYLLISNLIMLRDQLLPKLMSGKIRVPVEA